LSRRQNFQTIAWFWDLNNRNLLNLDPPYQRRSVWNEEYRQYFIDTILVHYPAPAIFLFEEMSPEGRAKYNVVDGKQRLTAIFDFVQNVFPVGDKADKTALRGLYFNQLDDETKTSFWSYQFLVEYIPSSDEQIINNIFDRINRNVAKLTPQELRHARFDGVFITVAEDLAVWMLKELPSGFPSILARSIKQMKEVEITATLLLFLDEGVKSYSQADLDKAFSDRDLSWEKKDIGEEQFKETIRKIKAIVELGGDEIAKSRLKNQADFYSLFGAVAELEENQVNPGTVVPRLRRFLNRVDDENDRENWVEAKQYFDAARSASNDAGPRRTRINLIKRVLTGELEWVNQ
jgi:hypothetical protein